MSGDERAASDGRQTDPDETAAVEQVLERSAEEPEEKLARLRRVALPSAQRIAGKRRRQSDALVRVLTSISMYSIPAIALLAAVGAIGYSAWAAWGVAQSAGSLDFSQVDAGFSQIDAALPGGCGVTYRRELAHPAGDSRLRRSGRSALHAGRRSGVLARAHAIHPTVGAGHGGGGSAWPRCRPGGVVARQTSYQSDLQPSGVYPPRRRRDAV